MSIARRRVCPRGLLASDAGLESLGALVGLRELDLTFNPGVTDASVGVLSQLEWLDRARISGTSITKAGADQLQAALPDCVVHW